VLGKRADRAEYTALFEKIKQAYLEEFVTARGRLASNTQTAYSLALAFDLLPEPLDRMAAERLAADVRKFGHITTGFLGTPLICHALTEYGYTDLAYMLLNRREYPSWLYPITKGATTIWERWDGIKPDGTFQDKGMNSFNHYAYGAIGDWLYRNTAGLNPDPREPGYRRLLIHPRPGGGLMSAKASLLTMYGPAESAWRLTRDRFELEATVPANSRATIILPNTESGSVTENGKAIASAAGITAVRQQERDVVIEAGSGSYRFVCERRPEAEE
jgi:alpha-L-rhamnosidase